MHITKDIVLIVTYEVPGYVFPTFLLNDAYLYYYSL
jgi:hypothetical protein